MILGIIPFEGIRGRQVKSSKKASSLNRLSYQHHNLEIPTMEDIEENKKKTERL